MRWLAVLAALTAVSAVRGEMEYATPESQGVDSAGILRWLDDCERTFDGVKEGRLHGFVIVRHGKVIAEGSWKPFDTLNEPHMLYSHSKSFTSSAVGFLVDDGRLDLDERVADVFPEDVPADADAGVREIRIRDLLTMNVGSDLNHDVPKFPDWRRRFFERRLDRKPGTGFKYDSDATYMLAAVVEKRSGRKLMDFLRERMFSRIGIEKAWSTTSPQGIACGGWGMNMTTREIARFGQLYLQQGRWNGEQLLSPYWVTLATARHTWSGWQKVGAQRLGEGTDWEQGYGFQFWRCTHGAYRADGASGQYTIVLPAEDAVVSINAGLNDMQKELALVWDDLLPAMKSAPLPEGAATKALAERCSALAYPALTGPRGDGAAFFGTDIVLDRNSRGFVRVRVDRAESGYRLTLEVPAGVQRIPVGDGEWKHGELAIDTQLFESLGLYIGPHRSAASAGFDAEGVFRIKVYLVRDTGDITLAIRPDGRLEGRFNAMAGCGLKGAVAP